MIKQTSITKHDRVVLAGLKLANKILQNLIKRIESRKK